jgi:CspA family cold shock protein
MTPTAIRPLRTHVVVVPESEWERVVVKWFNRIRGFGFLSREAIMGMLS